MKIILSLFLVLSCIFHLNAEDWEHFLGPNLDGISKEKGLGCKSFKEVWRADVHTGFSSIVVSKGKLYTMGFKKDKEYIFCLSVKNGKVLWSHSYPEILLPKMYEGGPNTTPTIHDGKLYTLSKSGLVLCLDAKTGKVLWKDDVRKFGASHPSWGFASPPTIVGQNVYFNTGNSGSAFDKDTGKVIWKSRGNKAGYGAVIPYKKGKKTTLLILNTEALIGVDPKSGNTMWSQEAPCQYNVNAVTPQLFGDQVFVSSGYAKGTGRLIDLSRSPRTLWVNKNMKNHFSNSVYLKGYIYGVHGNTGKRCQFRCISAKGGKLMWKEPMAFGSFRFADNKLFVLEDDGNLSAYKFSSKGRKKIKSRQILDEKCWTVPTISDKKLYARGAHGTLVCIDLK